ncbi:hypothetical protein HPP92_009783 [Vanilla planifolia]|uniref:Uncharacterized protein n=1 Tax=Vanilla planifolia TaxID=51239 RepID=A0A835R774_VANPL|nr:hypothetical protein HPP92_009783 [Vanilla planifolia]
MKTTGRAAEPRRRAKACSISFPRGSSSNSYTVGLTPMPQNSRFTAWHMQQVLTLKMTTALSAANLSTLSTAGSHNPLPPAAAMYAAANASYCIPPFFSRSKG